MIKPCSTSCGHSSLHTYYFHYIFTFLCEASICLKSSGTIKRVHDVYTFRNTSRNHQPNYENQTCMENIHNIIICNICKWYPVREECGAGKLVHDLPSKTAIGITNSTRSGLANGSDAPNYQHLSLKQRSTSNQSQ